MNPYLNRMMIREAADFVGRRRILADISDRLSSRKIVCIEGDRRIGKSSLLFHLGQQVGVLKVERPLYFSYIDLQQFGARLTTELLWGVLADSVVRFAGERAAAGSARETLEAAGKRLDESGRRAVILLDEFDLIALRPDFDPEFYRSLHSLSERYPVTVVGTTRFPLTTLSQAGSLAGFSFGTHFDCVHLGPLEEQEARELIGIAAERTGISLNPYGDWIIQEAGLRPFYLQMACAAVFDVLSERPHEKLNEGEAEQRFLDEALPHCRYQFSELWPAEQKALHGIAQREESAAFDPEIRSRLVHDGYLVEDPSGLQISSRMLRLFLTSRRPQEYEAASAGFSQPLSAGASLAHHLVREVLTTDCMGYLCHTLDQRAGRQSVLRVIDSTALEGMLSKELLIDQAQQAALLSHPVIAAPYEVSCEAELVLVASSWVRGVSLREIAGTRPRPEWRQWVGWMARVCDGLAAAHREGVFHRNLKPSNILIGVDRELHILDFGVPRHYHLMRSLSVGAAPSDLRSVAVQYLSPEQTCAEPADHRSDLFSIGVLLYEGLAGVSPFHSETVGDTLRAILNDHPPAIRLEEESSSTEANEIVSRLLEKSPSHRYQNARDVAADLRKLIKSRKPSRLWFR